MGIISIEGKVVVIKGAKVEVGLDTTAAVVGYVVSDSLLEVVKMDNGGLGKLVVVEVGTSLGSVSEMALVVSSEKSPGELSGMIISGSGTVRHSDVPGERTDSRQSSAGPHSQGISQ